MSTAVFYANANSRRGSVWFEPACAHLADVGIQLTDARLFEKNEEVVHAVADAQKKGVPMVIVGGGDGAISSIVHLLEGTGTTLGIMPFGTGNSLAGDLGIPTDVLSAAKIIGEGDTALIDVGIANGRRFMNVATLGLSALIAQDLSTGLKKVFAAAAYAAAIGRALLQVKPFKARLTLDDGTETEFEALQIVFGNGRFHAGGLLVAPDAAIDEGLLEIYALATTNKVAFLKLAMKLRRGKQAELDEVRTFRARQAHLEAWPSRKVILDGEALAQTPVEVAISPKKLKVAVPSGWDSRSAAPP